MCLHCVFAKSLHALSPLVGLCADSPKTTSRAKPALANEARNTKMEVSKLKIFNANPSLCLTCKGFWPHGCRRPKNLEKSQAQKNLENVVEPSVVRLLPRDCRPRCPQSQNSLSVLKDLNRLSSACLDPGMGPGISLDAFIGLPSTPAHYLCLCTVTTTKIMTGTSVSSSVRGLMAAELRPRLSPDLAIGRGGNGKNKLGAKRQRLHTAPQNTFGMWTIESYSLISACLGRLSPTRFSQLQYNLVLEKDNVRTT